MKKPRFLCDVDGILADTVGASIKFINEVTGQHLVESDINDFHLPKFIQDPRRQHLIDDEMNRQGFCLSILPYSGSKHAVELLKKLTDFYVVTAPFLTSEYWMHERMEWLARNFPISKDRVNFVTHKSIVHGDFLLDDSDRNLHNWLEENPNGQALLWDRPWNQNPLHPRVRRVFGWPEVMSILIGPTS